MRRFVDRIPMRVLVLGLTLSIIGFIVSAVAGSPVVSTPSLFIFSVVLLLKGIYTALDATAESLVVSGRIEGKYRERRGHFELADGVELTDATGETKTWLVVGPIPFRVPPLVFSSARLGELVTLRVKGYRGLELVPGEFPTGMDVANYTPEGILPASLGKIIDGSRT